MTQNSISKEVLVAEDVAWQLGGSSDDFQWYWIFDPHQMLFEFKHAVYRKRAGNGEELFYGLCETHWLEDSSDVMPGENVFFFRTEAEARTFQKEWYESR